jgi:hypothetical protein
MAATTIRRVGVLSVGKVMGLTYALIGLVAGGIFALFSFFGAALGSAMAESTGEAGGAIFGALFGVGAIIILPIFYGILGFLAGVLGAVFYNLVAGAVGGVELELGGAPGTALPPAPAPGYLPLSQ